MDVAYSGQENMGRHMVPRNASTAVMHHLIAQYMVHSYRGIAGPIDLAYSYNTVTCITEWDAISSIKIWGVTSNVIT